MADILSPTMLSYDVIVHILIVGAQCLLGVFINGFIVVVNAVNFIRKRQISSLDLLISSLAFSRVCQQIFACLLPLVLNTFIKQSVLQEFIATFTFINIWALWLATWLSVFYCAKIATIPHPLFSWLKMKISNLVPWLILGSTIFAGIGTGIHQNYMWVIAQNFLGGFLSSNENCTKRTDIASLSIFIFHLAVPSTIFFIAVLLLIFNLGRHTWKMRTTGMGTRSPCLSAPLRAMLPILLFLFLYFSFYGSAMVFFTQDMQNGRISILFWNLIGGSYPSIHSITLILGNVKQKEIAKKFLHCGQCGQ